MDTEDDKDKDIVYKREHALEKFLDIEPTELEKIEYEKPLKRLEDYDDKDAEIEEQAHEIFNEAMKGYHNLEQFLQAIEPKYRARMAEVALQYLKTGLDAANAKAKQKETKDKLTLREMIAQNSGQKTGNTTNILVSADRNEFLRELKKMAKEEDVVDGEVIDSKDIDDDKS
jgi:hypothetical protein